MSIQTQSETQYAFSKIHGLISEIVEKSANGNYIYRGEPEHYEDEKYNRKVSSTLYRIAPDRFDSGEFDLKRMQKSTLEDAKRYTDKRSKEDFELLTELQHYGSETSLIDFTTDYHIALFFGCDGSHDKDGRIILLRRTGEINEKYQVKEPWKPLNRVLAQKSIFVQPPNGFIDPDDLITVNVPANLKQWILIHLRKFQDISTESIYNDLHGFIKHKARQLSREAIFPRAFADNIVEDIESENISTEEPRERLQSAIDHYTTSIQYAPYNVKTYLKQGKCYLLITKFDCAIETFSKAILLEHDYVDAYLYRGFTYNIIGKHALAVENFTKVIKLKPDYAQAYSNRGLVFLHLQKWEKAKEDLTIAANMEIDIITLFRNLHSSIADFEKKHNVKLPEDIAALLTSPQARSENLPP